MNINNYNKIGQQNIGSTVTNVYESEKKLTSAQKDRLEMLEGLARRFKNRLKEKMKTEPRFKLELNLEYTKEGTNETQLKDYYIDSYEEKSAEGFDQLFQDYEIELKRLLILGEAGSGKTVLMLQFGLKLVELAKQNFDYPMPILLNLATWQDENQSFETWLEENLVYAAGEYGTAKKYAKEMVQENNLLLLLDGLDEIPEADRKACLDKLKPYLDKLKGTNANFPTLLMSCRKEDYLQIKLPKEPAMRANIQIAPLKPENIIKELEKIKPKDQTAKAQKLLNCITEMPEIATKLKSAFEVHLSLNMAHTFDFSQLTTENLVKAYLNQEIGKLEKEEPKAKHYLSFLATKMKENKKGIAFELVDMQSNWVNREKEQAINKFLDYLFKLNKKSLSEEILKFEIQKFIWKDFLLSIVSFLGVGIFFGFTIGTIITFSLKNGIILGIMLGFVGGLVSIFFNLFFIAKQNQKIYSPYKRLSAAFVSAITKQLVVFLITSLLYDFFYLDVSWSLYTMMLGCSFLNVTQLIIIPHFFLNFILFKKDGNTPLSYNTFLNQVSQTGIMEKDGGKWRFRHQLLMENLYKDKE
ncbi:MAG: NACHT domain-containing protein [Bacteroidetes bacterium]|nr:MAG: NACHT domain-containing protein [Bacteroidota bacterium]